jgi:ferredoxin
VIIALHAIIVVEMVGKFQTRTFITMADPLDRNPENVLGPFFVDNSCIDCDLCRESAPQFFTRSTESGQSYVHTQPVTEEEIAIAQQAMEDCPTENIGRE